MINYRHIVLFSFLLIFSSFIARSQDYYELELAKVGVEENRTDIDIYINLLSEGSPIPKDLLELNDFKVFETIEGKEIKQSEIYAVMDDTLIEKVKVSNEVFSIFLLIDNSLHTSKQGIENSKRIIKSLISRYKLPAQSKFYIKPISKNSNNWIEINKNNFVQELKTIKNSSTSQINLFEEVTEELRDNLRDRQGKKIIILFSSGESDFSDSPMAYSIEDVERMINYFGNDLYFFTVGIENNENKKNLLAFSKATNSTLDKHNFKNAPKLDKIIENTENYLHTHKIIIRPNEGVFAGEKRKYEVKLEFDGFKKHTEKVIVRGNPGSPIFVQIISQKLWFTYFLLGLGLVSSLLLVFLLFVPIVVRKNFVRKFVKKYKYDGMKKIIDPLTTVPIEDGDMIVEKCMRSVSFDTWKEVGWQCPSYPDCMYHQGCNGDGAPETKTNFFSMHGFYKKLNWLWFGALGGFLGWCLYAINNLFGAGLYEQITAFIYNIYSQVSPNPDFLILSQMPDISNNLISGIAFGIGLLFMLSFAEEKGQSRKISIGRILVKVMLGSLFAGIIFSLSAYLQFMDIIDRYVSDIIAWIIFGLLIGAVLSINSSISLKRGLLGGFLSGIGSTLMYFAISFVIEDYNIGRILSLILMGAILGFMLSSVIESFEEFEIELLSPKRYRRTFPISKWLKQDVEIDIGSDSGSYIFIKWIDPNVKGRHAKLVFDDNKVFISPFSETLIGKVILPLNKNSQLRNGDVIKLGRNSETSFRFITKNSKVVNNPSIGFSRINQESKDRLNLNFKKRKL